jgi:flagellar hook-associated protein 1 FlgK
MRGNGVQVVSIQRMHDDLADVTYRSEAAADGYAGARADVLDRAQSILGPVNGGTPAALDQFFAAFHTLAMNPTDPAVRETVLSAASTLTQSLRDASQGLTDVTSGAAVQVTGYVDQVNTLAAQVANLNQQILAARAGGQAPNDLLDQRDVALDQLHQIAGVTTHENSTGTVDVFLGSGNLVRGSTTYALEAGTGTGGVPTVTFAADGSAASVGGTLGGYLAVTTVDLPSLRQQLDAVASGLISKVNAVNSAGYGLDGTTGNAFFSGTNASDIAVAATLTANKIAASASGATNDGNNALTLAAAGDDPTAVALPGGGTTSLGDGLRALAGRLGTLASSAVAAHTSSSAAVDSANKLRSSENGVSVDEEMVDMLKYQHAYEAAARVVSTADSMLDTLINHLGVG